MGMNSYDLEKLQNNKTQRIGNVNYNNQGEKMTIIDYKNCNNVKVQFEDGHVVDTSYLYFKNGSLKNKFHPEVYGVGYLGVGGYEIYENKKLTKRYKKWKAMLERCYSDESLKKRPRYELCSVCEEWHNFQNFAKWYDKNYYEIPNKVMCLDKDILVKNNKIYSPDTCCFVPKEINNCFTKSNATRGDLPIGISYSTKGNPYRVRIIEYGECKTLGQFSTIKEAFIVYKSEKERYIKELADLYNDYLPKKVYEALYRYEVSITD